MMTAGAGTFRSGAAIVLGTVGCRCKILARCRRSRFKPIERSDEKMQSRTDARFGANKIEAAPALGKAARSQV
jgi:hypothetical protein